LLKGEQKLGRPADLPDYARLAFPVDAFNVPKLLSLLLRATLIDAHGIHPELALFGSMPDALQSEPQVLPNFEFGIAANRDGLLIVLAAPGIGQSIIGAVELIIETADLNGALNRIRSNAPSQRQKSYFRRLLFERVRFERCVFESGLHVSWSRKLIVDGSHYDEE
jgi:hypothetical protein